MRLDLKGSTPEFVQGGDLEDHRNVDFFGQMQLELDPEPGRAFSTKNVTFFSFFEISLQCVVFNLKCRILHVLSGCIRIYLSFSLQDTNFGNLSAGIDRYYKKN